MPRSLLCTFWTAAATPPAQAASVPGTAQLYSGFAPTPRGPGRFGQWYIENVILRSLKDADGVWLDGNGYDNGAWMCAGTSGGFNATNSPQSSQEIAAWVAAETAVASSARQQLIANGGFDGLTCMDFRVESLPQARDDPATCGQKLMATAAFGANHSNYNAVVAYGYDTGAGGYNDSTAAGAVAAFMIVRGQHWFFGISEYS